MRAVVQVTRSDTTPGAPTSSEEGPGADRRRAQRLLLIFGRLVPRKGAAAFLERGMPLLEKDIRLVIGGVMVSFGEDWRAASLPEPQAEVRVCRCLA